MVTFSEALPELPFVSPVRSVAGEAESQAESETAVQVRVEPGAPLFTTWTWPVAELPAGEESQREVGLTVALAIGSQRTINGTVVFGNNVPTAGLVLGMTYASAVEPNMLRVRDNMESMTPIFFWAMRPDCMELKEYKLGLAGTPGMKVYVTPSFPLLSVAG
jgi:hypothetical protein